MEKIKKTADYTIFKKRSGRYAVRDRRRHWINGEAKQAILVGEQLITLPRPRPVVETAEPAESASEAA